MSKYKTEDDEFDVYEDEPDEGLPTATVEGVQDDGVKE